MRKHTKFGKVQPKNKKKQKTEKHFETARGEQAGRRNPKATVAHRGQPSARRRREGAFYPARHRRGGVEHARRRWRLIIATAATKVRRGPRGLGIPASGLLPLAVVASEITLGATAYG